MLADGRKDGHAQTRPRARTFSLAISSSVFFIGDSQTALTWAREGRFRSSNVRQAAAAMTMIGATRKFNVQGVHHVPKEDNHACDILSRRGQ